MTEIDIILDEMRDLLQVKPFRRAIHHKIKELKYRLGAKIADHKKVESMIDNLDNWIPKMKNGRIFELTRLGEKLWMPSIPGFTDVEDCDLVSLFQIFPQEIIDYIVNYRTKKGIAVMLPGLTLPELEGRKFDLSFEKHHASYYTGIIYEHGGVKTTAKSNYPEIDLNPGDLKVLITYFKDHPHYFYHVFNSFLKSWKSTLDGFSQAAR
ncbi:MAG: hypothetical protein GTO45_39310 [Candidatus Aminicenantes bacterium]|nr:hypothetical protein [Candidatus Aminicenantes bacterium]NIM84678.1 hypothetical protein [Candidatus Aminicenantes bacterium]NIN24177.1 hypothetical protein [Candidatus Aminicenantes bacterium]NIN47902.1 hypothetical protein [Candidatus Aminicenantes bacterium]NIN90840.1 hypothetical protein [Candidatus Aminicenantes bacterium]